MRNEKRRGHGIARGNLLEQTDILGDSVVVVAARDKGCCRHLDTKQVSGPAQIEQPSIRPLGRSTMGIHVQTIEPHWNYLLAIERNLDELSRYVEFDERNFECFSIEIARILLACGAEVDVVCKQICKTMNPNSRASKIDVYRKEIVQSYPGIVGFEVLLPQFGLTLRPWDEWKNPNGVPFWWTAYNKTKHHRHTEYHRASLKNMLNAIAGLFVMVLYLCRDKASSGELVPAPQLLHVGQEHFRGITHSGNRMGFVYSLEGA
jgi:hypothetical protein